MSHLLSRALICWIRLQAAYWDWRLRQPITSRAWRRFERWHDDPAHSGTLKAVTEVRRSLVVTGTPAVKQMARPSRLAPASSATGRWRLHTARLATTALAVFMIGPTHVPPPTDEPLPEILETLVRVRAKPLRDGSVVRAGADSYLTIQFPAGKRLLSLSRGRAFFHVAKDKRPFIVRTPLAVIQARGTRFTVATVREVTIVTVIEGTVDVLPAPVDIAAAPAVLRGKRPVRAGEQARVSSVGEIVVVPTPDSDITDWATTLRFKDLKASEALALFNQANGGLATLSLSPGARDARITGTYLLDAPEQFALPLATETGGVVQIQWSSGRMMHFMPPNVVSTN